MSELRAKNFEAPDELVSMPALTGHIVALGETYVARYVHRAGWRWSTHVKPEAGTQSCQFQHQGFVVSGQLHVTMDDGAERTLRAGDVFDIPPGHDARVVGDEDFVTIEFRGARDWARPRISERVLATLLFTDIIGSTELASRMGDAAWTELLSRHYERLRVQLDRFRGFEVKTTGDGILALFDGAARAIRCAAALCAAAREDGLSLRAGVHTGEVERHTDGLHGVGVHVAARVMALAGPHEVLVSGSTVALLEGADLTFADAGEHELKGVTGPRRLYRLVTSGSDSAPATAA